MTAVAMKSTLDRTPHPREEKELTYICPVTPSPRSEDTVPKAMRHPEELPDQECQEKAKYLIQRPYEDEGTYGEKGETDFQLLGRAIHTQRVDILG